MLSLTIISGCGGGGGGSDNGDEEGTTESGDTDGGGSETGDTDGGDDGTTSEMTGSISGTIFSASGAPLDAIHVRIVNINDTGIQLGTFSGLGSDVSFAKQSGNSKLILDDIGVYQIDNIPPGSYKVLIEKMDDRSGAFDPDRYSAFVDNEQPPVAFPDEYYNGSNESSTDNPSDFTPVEVKAGEIASGVNIITNN